MAMTKTERETIENLIKSLKMPRAGCSEPFPDVSAKEEKQANGYEGVSRLYLDTWIIGPLELLLSDEPGSSETARRMSRR